MSCFESIQALSPGLTGKGTGHPRIVYGNIDFFGQEQEYCDIEYFDIEINEVVMDSADLAQHAFSRFLAIHHYLRRYERQISEHGVRPRQFSLLRFLHENGPTTVGDFQQYQHTSPSTASALIAQLEEQGFVTRSRSEKDNRVVIVSLTSKGRDVAVKAPMGGMPLFRRQLLSLKKKELEQMHGVLGEIMALMEVEED